MPLLWFVYSPACEAGRGCFRGRETRTEADRHREVGDNGQKGCFQPPGFISGRIQLRPGVPIADWQQTTAAGGIVAALGQKNTPNGPRKCRRDVTAQARLRSEGRSGPLDHLRCLGQMAAHFRDFAAPSRNPGVPPSTLWSTFHVRASVQDTDRSREDGGSAGRGWGRKTIKIRREMMQTDYVATCASTTPRSLNPPF